MGLTVEIISCINSGNIAGSTFNIGGVLGTGMGTRVYKCENQGFVSGSKGVGGIAGFGRDINF